MCSTGNLVLLPLVHTLGLKIHDNIILKRYGLLGILEILKNNCKFQTS